MITRQINAKIVAQIFQICASNAYNPHVLYVKVAISLIMLEDVPNVYYLNVQLVLIVLIVLLVMRGIHH